MRGLPTLIRLARHELDERRRVLAEVQARQDKLRMDAAILEARLETEGAMAQEAGPMAFAYVDYMRAALVERDRLNREADGLQPEVDKALEVVRQAFEEVKRLEMVEEAERLEARRKAEAAERAALDEISLERYQRRRRTEREGE